MKRIHLQGFTLLAALAMAAPVQARDAARDEVDTVATSAARQPVIILAAREARPVEVDTCVRLEVINRRTGVTDYLDTCSVPRTSEAACTDTLCTISDSRYQSGAAYYSDVQLHSIERVLTNSIRHPSGESFRLTLTRELQPGEDCTELIGDIRGPIGPGSPKCPDPIVIDPPTDVIEDVEVVESP